MIVPLAAFPVDVYRDGAREFEKIASVRRAEFTRFGIGFPAASG